MRGSAIEHAASACRLIETEADIAGACRAARRRPAPRSRSPRPPGRCRSGGAPAASRDSRRSSPRSRSRRSRLGVDLGAASARRSIRSRRSSSWPRRKRRCAPPACRAPKIRTLTGIAAACADGLRSRRAARSCRRGGDRRDDGAEGHRAVDGGDLPALLRRPPRHLSGRRPRAAERRAARARPRRRGRTRRRLRKLAEKWSPWRGVAARLFWAYYRARRDERQGR